MSDFSVTVGGDFSELLAGFRKLEQSAQSTGQTVGKNLGSGIEGVAGRSIDALLADLGRLKAQRNQIQIDGGQVTAVNKQIAAVQSQIDTLRNTKLAVQTDPRSIDGLTTKLNTLQAELNRTAIGSQKFKDLQREIAATEKELGKATQTATKAGDGFDIVDGVIAGFALSLTNLATNAIGSAISAVAGLVTNFAALDTEIRLAAAASGENDAYNKIAKTIDKVGIEAAGTQLEVAQLATELIRGGLTVDQVNTSLGAIVQGAEATGTGFAQMGTVVSASLKGFGLEAKSAKRVVDALVTGANASATSVDGLGNAFKYVAPVARVLGVDIEDAALAVGLLTNAGIDASEAGVTLRNGLSKLASAAPSAAGGVKNLTGQAKVAAQTMETLGINIFNTDGTLQPMETTLLKLKGAFDKLDPASKIRLAANLFGGEDDGTKWLALLNQSETDIKKMATAMANTKGATTTARNAMQGFQMAINQLTGTLDSIGITIGGVAATVLLPFVGVANQIVGAIAGLPQPVKQAATALGLMAGAVTTATAAVVLFQRAMTVTSIQTAGREIASLALKFRDTLKTSVAAAAGAIPGLLTQLKLIGQLDVGTALSALATKLKTTLANAFNSAKTAAVNFVAYLKSASFASFVAGAKSVVTALAPIALSLAAVGGAVVAWQQVLGGAEAGTDAFAEAQSDADEIIKDLGDTITKVEADSKPWWQSLLEATPIIGDVGLAVGKSRSEMEQLGSTQAFTKLQSSFTSVQTPALAFLTTLKQSNTVTASQSAQALKFASATRQIADTAKTAAAQLRAKAAAADAAGDPAKAENYRTQARALDSEEKASRAVALALTNQAARSKTLGSETADLTTLTKEQEDAVRDREKIEKQLNQTLAEAPVRYLDSQVTVGNQLLSLSKAIAAREDSRFNTIKAGLTFELQKLTDRGAGEDAIAAKKAQIDAVDRAALSARYQSLLSQQTLEKQILLLSQQKARAEANLSALQARADLLDAEKDLKDALATGDSTLIARARTQVQLQQAIYGVQLEKIGTLNQIQPIERAIASATAETALNGLKAEAAATGFKFAANGSLVPVGNLGNSLSRVATLADLSADAQDRFEQVANDSGLAIGRAASGTLVLGRNQDDVNSAVSDLNRELGGTERGFDNAAFSAGDVGDATGDIETGLKDASNPAAKLEGSFTKTGDKAPAIVQGSRDFAGWLSGAKGSGEKIEGLALDDKFASVAGSMGDAAGEAEVFYNWLYKAAGLPAARWTGGPVEAGGEYRINELGQEAFLSAGRLSLINAPANSIWRAPSSGVVVPAGVTARLQADGAIPVAGGGGSAGVAQLALEVGKLRQEVAGLARKDWNVHIQQRTGPTASQVMNQIHRLR